MALAGFGGRNVAAIFQNAAVFRTQFQQSQRMFRLGEARLKEELKDYVAVDKLSKIALVVDKKYKSVKEVPDLLPYRTVFKARDKFRVKASMGSAVALTIFVLYLIKSNQHIKRDMEYERLKAAQE